MLLAELHLMIIETLMKAENDIVRDLLMLIAYGSVRSKVYSVRILYYLFPHLVPPGEETYLPAQNDFSKFDSLIQGRMFLLLL